MKEIKSDLKTLNLKIPTNAHANLKIFATQENIRLIPFAQQLIADASANREFLEQSANKLKNRHDSE